MTESIDATQPAAVQPKDKEKPFDPSRMPISPASRSLVEDIRIQLLNYEAQFHPRIRQRQKDHQDNFDRMVSAIVCDLMHAAIIDPEGWRYISLSKQQRARDDEPAFMTNGRIGILDWMTRQEMEWIELRKGVNDPIAPRQSTIRASARLRRYMDERGIQLQDFGRDPDCMGDPIVLKGRKARVGDKLKAETLDPPRGEIAETYRAEMRRINYWLATADIRCEGLDPQGNEWDVSKRCLSRIFNDGRLDQGGRLYHGFWIDMSTQSRLEDLRLCGEPVASLDFKQCGIRIAYGHVGTALPPGDLYCVPGLEGYREGVKVMLTSQLSRTGEMMRKPVGTSKRFHKDMTLREIEEPILRHHHPIRTLFYTGFGLTMQFIESQILIQTLLRLIDHGIVALPVHDCVIVPRSAIQLAEQTMLEVFRKVAGVPGAVEVEVSADI